MTLTQITTSTTNNLLIIYKNKARCFHSENKANAIYKELEKRIGVEELYELRLSVFHMKNGEGDGEFNQEIDKLLQKRNNISKMVKVESK